jgi:hypothetical protein
MEFRSREDEKSTKNPNTEKQHIQHTRIDDEVSSTVDYNRDERIPSFQPALLLVLYPLP